MARFDVYRGAPGQGYLLDCQTDYLSGLSTRLTVPLFLRDSFPHYAARLNPVFQVERNAVVMLTQYASAIETPHLDEHVTSLADQQDTIMNALDMLLTGY